MLSSNVRDVIQTHRLEMLHGHRRRRTMRNPYRNQEENPPPEAAIDDHAALWEVIRHIRTRGLLTDERVLFMLKYMFPPVYAMLMLILGTLIATH
jgi:hypothetical protein